MTNTLNQNTLHWDGNDQIKVFCLDCRNTFPANVKWLDLSRSLPQIYKYCPYCKRAAKVRIIR